MRVSHTMRLASLPPPPPNPRLRSLSFFVLGTDAASISTRAERRGEDYVLNGAKAFISGGGESDVYLVMARTGSTEEGARGISSFIVPKDAKGEFYKKEIYFFFIFLITIIKKGFHLVAKKRNLVGELK